MPFIDGYYPNWTTSQPKPRLPFSNCITYKGAPYNAKITSIVYNYEFQEAVLVADYEVMMGFFGAQPQNQFIYPLKSECRTKNSRLTKFTVDINWL